MKELGNERALKLGADRKMYPTSKLPLIAMLALPPTTTLLRSKWRNGPG